MDRRARAPRGVFGLGLLLGAGLGLGCSATRFDNDACTSNDQCRATFGLGATCGGDGLCLAPKTHPRCTTSYPEDLFARSEAYRDAVVFGSLMDQSSAAHRMRERAVRLAIKEADGVGGIAQRKAVAVFCDIAEDTSYGDGLSRQKAAVATATFLDEVLGVKVIIGPSASTDVSLVWQSKALGGPVIVTPAATSPALLDLEPVSSDETPGRLWRVAPPDSIQGLVIADDMTARGVTSAMVIRETGAYGEGLAKVFQERFSQGGGSVMLQSIADDTQIGEAAARAAGSPVTEILFISSQQDWVVKFLNAASSLAPLGERGLFLTDTAANKAVLDRSLAAQHLFPRVRGTRPEPRDLDDPVFASFVANYQAQYEGQDPREATFADHSYDATWLGIYGATWSLVVEGALSPLGIGRGLRRVSEGAAFDITPSSLAGITQAFRDGASVNVRGASSDLDFHPQSRDVRAPFEIWLISAASGQPQVVHAETRMPD